MSETTYMSLEYYTKFAERLINKFMRVNDYEFQPTDEMIGYIVRRMIRAEEKYDYSLVKESNKRNRTEEECRKYYLRMEGIYGIRAYMNSCKKKKNNAILATDIDYKQDTNILSNIYVNYKHMNHNEHYIDDKRIVEILLENSKLTDKQKLAIVGHAIDGKTFETISAECDPPVSPQAISSAYQTALQKLRKLIK